MYRAETFLSQGSSTGLKPIHVPCVFSQKLTSGQRTSFRSGNTSSINISFNFSHKVRFLAPGCTHLHNKYTLLHSSHRAIPLNKSQTPKKDYKKSFVRRTHTVIPLLTTNLSNSSYTFMYQHLLQEFQKCIKVITSDPKYEQTNFYNKGVNIAHSLKSRTSLLSGSVPKKMDTNEDAILL